MQRGCISSCRQRLGDRHLGAELSAEGGFCKKTRPERNTGLVWGTCVPHAEGGILGHDMAAAAAAAATSVVSDSVRPHRRQPIRLPRPWDSLGKNTGVGCHFLLQCIKVKSESKVTQSCPTPSDSMDCSPPGSSVHRIFQARVLEWGAIAFSEYSA